MRALEQMKRCQSPARWPAAFIFRALRALGITAVPMPGGKLLVQGPPDAVTFLADAIEQNKQALLAGPCRVCGVELATEVSGRCRWCEMVRGRRVYYPPGSPAEQRVIAALIAVIPRT